MPPCETDLVHFDSLKEIRVRVRVRVRVRFRFRAGLLRFLEGSYHRWSLI